MESDGHISAIPSKNVFSAIIADYDFNLAICELIDNSLTMWLDRGASQNLEIEIQLEKNQQIINFKDNAGGIERSKFNYIIAPGLSTTSEANYGISQFGVGSKRAVIALSDEIEIISRFENHETFRIFIDKAWIQSDEWDLEVFKTENISEGTMEIEMIRLRYFIDDVLEENLKKHIGLTYSQFIINENIRISVNSEEVVPIHLENWAVPKDSAGDKQGPRIYKSVIFDEERNQVNIRIIGGLITDTSINDNESGVFMYCNNRLIAKGLKNPSVGFLKKVAGSGTHPSINRMRVIIHLNGPAFLMPWDSTKSRLNTNHNTYVVIKNAIYDIVSYHAKIARFFQSAWNQLLPDSSYSIPEYTIDVTNQIQKSYFPQLPKTRFTYLDKISDTNESIMKQKPWTKGLCDSIVVVDILEKKKMNQKNRINLIILDSALEIAFKEYIINHRNIGISAFDRIKRNRSDVVKEVKKSRRLNKNHWNKINYYYKLRCDLIHERISPNVTDEQITEYREIVEECFERLFGLRF